VNNSIAAAAPTSPLLQRRAANERPEIDAVNRLAARTAVVPLLAVEPIGIPALAALAGR
jgi:arsenite-transporting ATPase